MCTFVCFHRFEQLLCLINSSAARTTTIASSLRFDELRQLVVRERVDLKNTGWDAEHFELVQSGSVIVMKMFRKGHFPV